MSKADEHQFHEMTVLADHSPAGMVKDFVLLRLDRWTAIELARRLLEAHGKTPERTPIKLSICGHLSTRGNNR